MSAEAKRKIGEGEAQVVDATEEKVSIYPIPQWVQSSITTAIGAVVGFASAIVTDVVKTRISEKRKRAAIRKALYRELLAIYVTFRETLSAPTDRPELNERISKLLTGVSIDVYKSAISQPEIFYGLKEATIIEYAYVPVTALKNHYDLPGSGTAAMQVRDQFMRVVEQAVDSNKLDQTLLPLRALYEVPSEAKGQTAGTTESK